MLQEKKIGFIGGGAMAEALLRGMINTGLIQPQQIIVSDIIAERRDYLAQAYAVLTTEELQVAAKNTDILFLAVKPQVVKAVMEQLSGQVATTTIVVSIVAGLTLAALQAKFPGCAVIRVMPNTPIAVGAGMSALALGKLATKQDSDLISRIFSSAGTAVTVGEELMDAVTGLSGSGPAYGFVMIDALADAGVSVGLSRQTALVLAAQTLLGAAKMVLETGEHPAKLRDMVTSPGGTAITGIHVLEQNGLRAALIDAVKAATKRSQEMGKK